MENDNSTPKKRDRTFYRDKASLRKNANRFLQRHGTQTGDYLFMIAILNYELFIRNLRFEFKFGGG